MPKEKVLGAKNNLPDFKGEMKHVSKRNKAF